METRWLKAKNKLDQGLGGYGRTNDVNQRTPVSATFCQIRYAPKNII